MIHLETENVPSLTISAAPFMTNITTATAITLQLLRLLLPLFPVHPSDPISASFPTFLREAFLHFFSPGQNLLETLRTPCAFPRSSGTIAVLHLCGGLLDYLLINDY